MPKTVIPPQPTERLTPDGNVEGKFRATVRDILNFDIFTRDETIYEELRRLKKLDDGDL